MGLPRGSNVGVSEFISADVEPCTDASKIIPEPSLGRSVNSVDSPLGIRAEAPEFCPEDIGAKSCLTWSAVRVDAADQEVEEDEDFARRS